MNKACWLCGVDEPIEVPAAGGQTADRIAAVLRVRITEGRLPPGTPIRDAALANEFGVSRNTVREALRLLGYEGLLTHQLHKGVSVRRMTPADVRDVYTVRRALELRAIEESAVAPVERLDALEDAVRTAEQALRERQWGDVGTASLAFHQRIVALLGSVSLDEFFGVVLARLRLTFALAPDEGRFQVPWVARDRAIADAVLQGRRDDAAAAMRLYLDDSERSVLDVVRAGSRPPQARRGTDGAAQGQAQPLVKG